MARQGQILNLGLVGTIIDLPLYLIVEFKDRLLRRSLDALSQIYIFYYQVSKYTHTKVSFLHSLVEICFFP